MGIPVRFGLDRDLFVSVSVPVKVANVPSTAGNVMVVVPAIAFATRVEVPEVAPGKAIPWASNVCFPVNVCAASVRAMLASVAGKVIVFPSVPARIKLLFAARVFPLAMVKVDPEAGVVMVTLLIEVAVATPRLGVTKLGLVSITNVVPVPV